MDWTMVLRLIDVFRIGLFKRLLEFLEREMDLPVIYEEEDVVVEALGLVGGEAFVLVLPGARMDGVIEGQGRDMDRVTVGMDGPDGIIGPVECHFFHCFGC